MKKFTLDKGVFSKNILVFCYFVQELVGQEKLKEAGLENFPFDVTKDQIVHPPKLVKFLFCLERYQFLLAKVLKKEETFSPHCCGLMKLGCCRVDVFVVPRKTISFYLRKLRKL